MPGQVEQMVGAQIVVAGSEGRKVLVVGRAVLSVEQILVVLEVAVSVLE